MISKCVKLAVGSGSGSGLATKWIIGSGSHRLYLSVLTLCLAGVTGRGLGLLEPGGVVKVGSLKFAERHAGFPKVEDQLIGRKSSCNC